MCLCSSEFFFFSFHNRVILKFFWGPKTNPTRPTAVHVFWPFKAVWVAKVTRTQVTEVIAVTFLPLDHEALVKSSEFLDWVFCVFLTDVIFHPLFVFFFIDWIFGNLDRNLILFYEFLPSVTQSEKFWQLSLSFCQTANCI